MSNIESKYGLYDCWKCLCEVCTRRHCPKDYLYLSQMNHCIKMRNREACPTVKCDWFEHKEKIQIFHVRRHGQKPLTLIMEKLDLVLELLEKSSP